MAKLLISDYDDTLFTDEQSLKENIKKIKEFQKQGNIFTIATSRSLTSIMDEINKYNIPYDYLFVNVGAGIFDNLGNNLYVNFISKEEKEEIEKILEKYENLKITRYGIIEEQEKTSTQIIGYKIKGELNHLDCLYNTFTDKLKNFEVVFKRSEGKLFLNHKNNTKEQAINKLIEKFPKYKDYEVITVGNDDVDFGMLQLYDGYCMKNSSELLLKNIRKIVSSVGELV